MEEAPPPAWSAWLVRTLYRRRRLLGLAVLALVAAAVPLAPRWFRADNSARVWLLEGDPALTAYDRFQDRFGNDEVVVVAMFEPGGVYTPPALERVRALSRRLQDHPLIRRVDSVALSTAVEGDAIEIRVDPLLGDGPIGPAEAAEVQRRVRADRRLARALVGTDDRVTLVIAQLVHVDRMAGQRPAILAAIERAVADEVDGRGGDSALGGIGVVYEALNRAVLHDTVVFIGLSFALVLAGLGLFFRRLLWVGVGLVVIASATLIAAGMFGALDRKMNMVTSIMPTLMLTVGVLDLVHLVEAWHAGPPGEAIETGLVRSLAVVVVPCVFNTVTDAIGFASLGIAPMGAIRDFGILAAVGLLVLLVLSLVIAVPLLARYGGMRPVPAGGRDRLTRMVLRMGGLSRTRRGQVAVLAAGLAVSAGAVAGITRLEVDTYTLEFLRAGHPVRQDHRRIEQGFGDYLPLELVATAPEGQAVIEPPLLRALDAAAAAIDAHPQASRVTGLADVVRRINQVVMDGDPAEDRIPDTRAAVAQELLLYESDPDAELDRLVDGERQGTRITARVPMTSARELGGLIGELEAAGRDALARGGAGAELHASGYLPLYVRITEHLTWTQVSSFALAFALVAVILMLLLRSVTLGLVSMVPNLIPALVVLGGMGLAGIRLDVGTVLLASIVLGVSVNDTSHIMFRYRHELTRSPAAPAEALARTLAGTGRAVLASSLVLALGFAVLALASTKSIGNFGLLGVVAILVALIADLVLTPALLQVAVRPRSGDAQGHRGGAEAEPGRLGQ